MSGELNNCAAVKDFFALYLYGELSFDEEERVESHLDACVDCRKALERQREVQVALDNIAMEPSPFLLRSCREELHMRLAEESQSGQRHGFWERFTDMLTGRSASAGLRHTAWLKPAGALTLIALGFGVARLVPQGAFGSGGPFEMGVMEPASRVRYVEPASDGKVQIVLDETRQRIVSGGLNDQNIRVLLLAAAKDPSDPGLRAETVEILNSSAQSSDVRDALVFALLHDQNAGVRLKVMQGLTPFAQQPEVRAAMTQVLLTDSNPGLRTQAIDLLTKGLNQDSPSMSYDRQVIGAMQELMQRENNAYVRQRCKAALEAVKASTETY
jgi:Putative zinc-finger/HEAT repeats